MAGKATSDELIDRLLENYIKELRQYRDEAISIQNELSDPDNDHYDVLRIRRKSSQLSDTFSMMRTPFEKLALKVSQLIDNGIIDDPFVSLSMEVKLSELEALITGVEYTLAKCR